MKKTILLNLVVLLLTAALAPAATRLVPDEYATIQAAIDAAVDGDVVIIAPGTYTGDGNRDIDFLGKAITVRSIDPNDPNTIAATIINCNGTGADPHRGFCFHSNEDANSVVDGFTITNGHGLKEQFGSYTLPFGGAIYCTGSGPTITNCIITGNKATYGAGIFAGRNGNPTITNCTIIGNNRPGIGGGYTGGGIYCWWNSAATITDCTISGNHGAGIYFHGTESPSAEISNCEITDNSCVGISFRAGTINNCTISNNGNAGILCSVSGTAAATISNCIISGNNANFDGGGIRMSARDDGIVTIINCTITGNQAIRGGGVSCRSTGNTIITNSIVRNNTGKDIYVWNFVMPPNGDWTTEPTELTVSYSCPGVIFVQKDPIFGDPILIFGDGNIDADPLFVEPGYWDVNGVWVDGDYHLLTDSPCIDAGDPNYVAEPNETDLDGRPRVLLGRIDMGAYEFNHIPIADAGPDREVYAWIDGIAEVTLDGAGSFDDDGHPLTYLWSWTIDGQIYDANGVNPSIELPVGEQTIELIVNDGIDDSEPDEVVITVIEPRESLLRIAPRVINRHSRQPKILALVRLPEDVARDQIDSDEPLLLYPGGIEAMSQHVIESRRQVTTQTSIFALFDKAELMDAVSANGEVELQVVGNLKTGQYFGGTDTVRIISPRDDNNANGRPRRRGNRR